MFLSVDPSELINTSSLAAVKLARVTAVAFTLHHRLQHLGVNRNAAQ